MKEMRCGPKINISFRRRQSMIVFFRAGIVLFLPPLSDSRSFVRRPRRVLYAYLCLPMRHSRLRRLFNHPPNSPPFPPPPLPLLIAEAQVQNLTGISFPPSLSRPSQLQSARKERAESAAMTFCSSFINSGKSESVVEFLPPRPPFSTPLIIAASASERSGWFLCGLMRRRSLSFAVERGLSFRFNALYHIHTGLT